MKILITGIHSALGKAIADGLDGHDVIGLARREHPRYRTILCDLLAGVPPLPAFDVCLHLAFITDPKWCRERPADAYRINVTATQSLLGRAGRFVFLSTGSVYGFRDGLSDEARRPEPEDDYTRLKYEAEQVVLRRANAAVLRPFWPYGPATRPDSVVNRLITRVASGAEVELHEGGRPRLSPVYISDLVAAARLFCLGELSGVYNVAGPQVASIEEMAGMIGRLLGRRPVFRATGKCVKDVAGSTEKIAPVFRPRVDLLSGLRRTIDYLRRHCP
jgi:nucleoside-diphosphate-sugar epimerase